MAHANEELIHRFYEAFAKRDADAMAACYHTKIVFEDPVFKRLEGDSAGAMWKMLCKRATDLHVQHSAVSADDATGKAHWDATYTFGQTGRKVVNRIDASFKFRDGLIVEHIDRFDFYRWTRMALGPIGTLLGWSPIVQNKVRAQAADGLRKFLAS